MVALADRFTRETYTPQNRTAHNSYRPKNAYTHFSLQPKNRGPATKNRILSTKYLDQELEWYYYGFRYYSPELGRWPSRDPMGEWGSKLLYSYCENTPVISVDGLGLFPTLPELVWSWTGPWINVDTTWFERFYELHALIIRKWFQCKCGETDGCCDDTTCGWYRDGIEFEDLLLRRIRESKREIEQQRLLLFLYELSGNAQGPGPSPIDPMPDLPDWMRELLPDGAADALEEAEAALEETARRNYVTGLSNQTVTEIGPTEVVEENPFPEPVARDLPPCTCRNNGDYGYIEELSDYFSFRTDWSIVE
jgi:RHS repeat-associated protein